MATLYEYLNTGDDDINSIQGTLWHAQTFTPATAHTITSVKVKVYRVGNPGTFTVSIRAVDVNGRPTGADLCSGTYNGDTFDTGTGGTWYEITFGAGTPLTASTKYGIVMRATAGDASNLVRIRTKSSGGYAGGTIERSNDSGSSWTEPDTSDLLFEDWGNPAANNYTQAKTEVLVLVDAKTISSKFRQLISSALTLVDARTLISRLRKDIIDRLYLRRFNSSLSFDGIDDYVDVGSNASIRFDKTTDFSWSFWIKPNTLLGPGPGYQTILSEHDSANYKFIGLEPSVQGAIRFDYGGSADITGVIITVGVWQHLVLTHIANTTNYLIYVNGVLKDTLVSTGSGVNTANKLIGVSTSSNFPFNGLIDEVRMYNRTLGADEVDLHYRGKFPSTTGLVGFWKFNEKVGSATTDSSGSGNNGTIYGATWNTEGAPIIQDIWFYFLQAITSSISLVDAKSFVYKMGATIRDTITMVSNLTTKTIFYKTITDIINLVDSFYDIASTFFINIIDSINLIERLRIGGTWWSWAIKHISTWTQQTKNTATWTQQSKNTASWTFQDKSED